MSINACFFAVVILKADKVSKNCASEGERGQLPFKPLVLMPFQFVTFVVLKVTILHKQSYSMCLKKDVNENIFNV